MKAGLDAATVVEGCTAISPHYHPFIRHLAPSGLLKLPVKLTFSLSLEGNEQKWANRELFIYDWMIGVVDLRCSVYGPTPSG